eukprot:gene14230-13527_t
MAGLRAMPAEKLRDELGFRAADPKAELEEVLSQSLTELSTGVCISQRGHFLIDGVHGGHNQLCMPPKEPVTFLSIPGLDFCSSFATVREAAKYFERDAPDDIPPHKGWKGWLPDGKKEMLSRIRRLYRAVFSACRAQKVRSPSMLPLGLGVFLANLHDDISRLRCDVVPRTRPTPDSKFLAVELAKIGQRAGLLNPSDCRAVMVGLIGCFWECQRGDGYVGEEDIACTSTHITAARGVMWPPKQIHPADGEG